MKPITYHNKQWIVPPLKLLLSADQAAADLYPLFPLNRKRTAKN